eukprot:2048870-Pyramimonas_sp.AAC.1
MGAPNETAEQDRLDHAQATRRAELGAGTARRGAAARGPAEPGDSTPMPAIDCGDLQTVADGHWRA